MQVFMICRVHNPFGICGEKKKKKTSTEERNYWSKYGKDYYLTISKKPANLLN